MIKKILLKEIDKYCVYNHKKNQKLDFYISGLSIYEEKICSKIQNCPMQQWFYQRKELFENIYGIKRMKKLQIYIEEWHEETDKICKIFAKQEEIKRTLLEKILSVKKRENNEKKYLKEQDKINLWRENIKGITVKIEKKLKMMRNRLNAMPQELLPQQEV